MAINHSLIPKPGDHITHFIWYSARWLPFLLEISYLFPVHFICLAFETPVRNIKACMQSSVTLTLTTAIMCNRCRRPGYWLTSQWIEKRPGGWRKKRLYTIKYDTGHEKLTW